MWALEMDEYLRLPRELEQYARGDYPVWGGWAAVTSAEPGMERNLNKRLRKGLKAGEVSRGAEQIWALGSRLMQMCLVQVWPDFP